MTLQSIEIYASQILACSQQMYSLAEQGDWDSLSKLEEERTLILDSLFNHPSVPSSLSSVSDILQRVIDIDHKTMELGKNAQHMLEKEMKLFDQSKRARVADAYLGNVI